MKKFFLFFLVVLFLNFVALVGAQAIPFELEEDGSGLTPDNVWTDGEIYSFLGSGIDLTAGQYDFTFSINGKVWQKGDGDGWETSDRIIVEVFLNDSLFSSTIGSGLQGQLKPFDLSLELNFDLSTDGILDIYAYSDVSSTKELWLLADATLTGALIGINYNEKLVVPTPEPATMLLLGTGLVALAGFGRKKFFKK